MIHEDEFTIIFLHIPKTAGTTLRAIIENVYNYKDVYFIYSGNKQYFELDDFLKLSKVKKDQIKIISSHTGFGIHKNIKKPCKYITILRDPVEYTISLYHHLINKNNAKNDEHVAALQKHFNLRNLSLQDFVTSGITVDVDNVQTRLLSGVKCGFGQCASNMLDTAKKNLREHFAAVGFTERFDESVVLFQKILGWPTPFHVKQNVSPKRSNKSELPQETLHTIRRQNEFDFELYRFARDLFDEQIEKQGPSFSQDVADFKIANRFAEELLQNQKAKYLLQRQIDDLKNSWSWRVTAPMRKTIEIINRFN